MNNRPRSGPFFRTALLLAVAVLAATAPAQGPAQDLAQNVDDKLYQSYRAMYNSNFNEALRQIEQAKALSKDDPLPYAAEACAMLFREFDRLHVLESEKLLADSSSAPHHPYVWDANAEKAFQDALTHSDQLAQARLAHDGNDVRALLALSFSNGLRADNAGLMTLQDFTALTHMKTADTYAMRLLSLRPDSYDAYVTTGVGKYIIGARPAPVRWMLKLGGFKADQAEGLKELALGAERGKYMAPFARILLVFDDLRHNRINEAREKLNWLHGQFPDNPLFVHEIARLDRPSTARSQ